MSQNPDNIVNPGTVNVVNQGDGLLSVDQPVGDGPSQNPGPLVQGGSASPGLGTDSPDQPVTVSPAMTAQITVDGGLDSPTSPNEINTMENNVVDQIYGQGDPANVFV